MNAVLWLALAFSSEAMPQPGEACRPCHAAQVDAFRKTGMGRSIDLQPAPSSATFYHRRSNRHYEISRKRIVRYQSDPQGRRVKVLEKSISFAIGSGNHAITFIHQTPQGRLLELPLSWYRQLSGYAMSPGYDSHDHPDFRREISGSCLFCHSAGPKPAPIDCHRCHGPVEAHLQAPAKGNILNPVRLEPRRQLEVCLQCHLETNSRGIQDSVRRPGRDVWSFRPGEPLSSYKLYFDRADSLETDRFEINHAGYRLLQSRCYQASRDWMVCTTCHDPHTARVRKDSCTQCHSGAHQSGDVSAGQSCEPCHMPRRVPVDAVHTVMTDHKIVRRPRFTNPKEEDHLPYTGPVVPYYEGVDSLSLALAQVRDATPEAEALYRRALLREPDSVPLLAALGKTLLRLGRPQDAVPVLQKAVRLDPMHTDSRTYLGVAHAVQGNHKEAIAQLRRAVADNPDHSLAWTNLGVTLEAVGDRKGAWEAYTEAIRLQPDSAEARRRRAQLASK